MRTRKFTYTLTAANNDGYLLNVTGAGPWTTFLAQPGDGCSHQVSLTSSDDLSGITFTLLGTDADGKSITEDITGPNNSAVYSVKFYATLVKVTASSTVGTLHYIGGWLGGGVGENTYTPTYPIAIYPHIGNLVGVKIVSGTMTYTVEQTNDNVFDLTNTPTWFTLGTANLDVDSTQEAKAGVTAERVNVTAYSSIVYEVTYVQPRK